MVQRLRNREEVILMVIAFCVIVVVGGAVLAAFGSSSDSLQIALAILGFGGTILTGLFAALKIDKAEGNIQQSQATTQQSLGALMPAAPSESPVPLVAPAEPVPTTPEEPVYTPPKPLFE